MTATPLTGSASPLNGSRQLVTVGTRGTVIAAIGYALAWIAGLSVYGSSTQVNASGMQVVRALAGHQFAAGLQYALTEGVTALFLITVVWGVTRNARSSRAVQVMRLAGLAATVISLAECGLGLWLSTGLAHPGEAATAGTVNDAITRLDGLKMLLLALVAAAAAIAVAGRKLPLPRWLSPLAAVLSIAIAVSGIGYLALSERAASAAWVSLPLLIVFVTAAGLATARSGKRPATAGNAG
jgi:hypothetical protein